MEHWKDIPGYEGYYQVSDHGRVRSKRHGTKILTLYNASGWVRVTLMRDKVRSEPTVHRLVASAFIPTFEKKNYIKHLDGDKLNNHADNLMWTPSALGHIVQLLLSDGSSVVVKSNDKPSIMTASEAHVFLSFKNKYAYSMDKKEFGTIEYLKKLNHYKMLVVKEVIIETEIKFNEFSHEKKD